MPVDFLTLLRRDHSEFRQELTQLIDPAASVEDLRTALDGVRLGLTAHVEAQDIVLGRFEAIPALQTLVDQARTAHRAQEELLSELVRMRPQTPAWRERAQQLRTLVAYHSDKEEASLLPALRTYAPTDSYARLAGAFATERLRQLAMLQPSAPMFLPDLVQMRAS
jgi:hypothetical protein